jgi:Resolvase, N terminal domain
VTNKLTPEHLQRRAIVYVRQSTLIQVVKNRESQLRQYHLADYARELGFVEVETIDEDQGRSGSGLIERPGFRRLVTEVCEGQVGAVFWAPLRKIWYRCEKLKRPHSRAMSQIGGLRW